MLEKTLFDIRINYFSFCRTCWICCFINAIHIWLL